MSNILIDEVLYSLYYESLEYLFCIVELQYNIVMSEKKIPQKQ